MINYCKIEDCEKRVVSRALMACLMHYKRYMKHGTMNKQPIRISNRVCDVNDCNTKHANKGYCIKHYRQIEKHGHILTAEEKHNNLSIAAKNRSRGITPLSTLERKKFNLTTRQLVMQRDGYVCQICDETGLYLHVDHIKSWSDYPELRFTIDNCRTVCRPCHYYITYKRKMPKSSKWGFRVTKRRVA